MAIGCVGFSFWSMPWVGKYAALGVRIIFSEDNEQFIVEFCSR